MLSDINMKKGESECQYYIDKLEYLDDRQRDTRIEQCKSLLCHGELRNKSGTVSKTHTQLSLLNTLLLWLPFHSSTQASYYTYGNQTITACFDFAIQV